MKKRWTVLLAVLCLLCTMLAPMAMAEGEITEGTTEEPTANVTRIEAEDFAASTLNSSTHGVKTYEPASGGKLLNELRQGDVIFLGDIDLTGLESIAIAHAHNVAGTQIGFYLDGTKGMLGQKIATITSTANKGWEECVVSSALVDVPAIMLTGTHKLYMVAEKAPYGEDYSGILYCGNPDYVELTFGDAPITETKFELEWASSKYADFGQPADYYKRSKNGKGTKDYGDITALESTSVGDLFYLGEYDLTGLQKFTFCTANNQLKAVEYAIYIDGTKYGFGTKIASLTGVASGGWDKFVEYSFPVTADADTVAGQHTLWLSIEGSSGYGGNHDWISFTQAKVTDKVLANATTHSFTTMNTATSTGSYAQSDQIKIAEGGAWSGVYSAQVKGENGAVLAYDNIKLDGVKTLKVQYIPRGTVTMNVYRTSVSEENLLGSYTLDNNDNIPNYNGGNSWYSYDKVRSHYFDWSALNLSGTDTLFFEIDSTATDYAGNYVDFTLFGEEILSDSVTVEVEDYTWMHSVNKNNPGIYTDTPPHVDSTRNGDTFHLGKMDITNLKAFTLRVALAANVNVQFYADLAIPDDLTVYDTANNRYHSDNWTGEGTLLGEVALTGTNGSTNVWTDYGTFTAPVETDLTGVHDIYMTLVRGTGTDFTGNYDYVRAVGVSEVDATTSLIGNIEIVGNGSVTIPDSFVYGGTMSLTPVAAAGNEFIGYEIDGVFYPANDTLVPVNANQTVKVIFNTYGETYEGIRKIEGENYVWGVSDATQKWEGSKNDTNGNKAYIIDNTRLNDTFYLGKMDLTGLTDIATRAVLGTGGTRNYEFYIDMDVDFAALGEAGAKKYAGTANVTGGTKIATVVVSQTCGTSWTTFENFSAPVIDGVSGEHEVYLRLTHTSDDWHGGIDSISFLGLDADTAVDISSNWPSDKLTVTFQGKFNQVMFSGDVTSAEELANLINTLKAPALGGYTFCGWDELESEAAVIFDTNKNNTEPFVIDAVYAVEEVEKRTTYDVTVGANIASANQTVAGTTIAGVYFDERVELTLAEGVEGTVAYWLLDGQKLAYGEATFIFYVTGDNNVSVVLDDGTDIVPESSVAIQQTSTSGVELNGVYTYTLSVIAQTYIPEGNATEFGVYYAADTAAFDAIKAGQTANVVKVKSSKTGNNKQYMTHLLGVKENKTRYAIAYMVVNGETVYSTRVVEFITDNAGNVATTLK